jgi:dTDP-4-amino-4,6-dideoxygalactose transaminase
VTDQHVPLVDLGIQHSQIAEEVAAGFDRVLDSGAYILGPEVESFERAFAEYAGVSRVVGVGNGTDALELALRAGGVQPGAEVVLPANTFVATAEAVVRAGARVRLVDCDENFLIDPGALESAMSKDVRAVVGVHLYGQTAPMELLRDVAGRNVLLVEDAAQSQGARRHGVSAGGLGDVAGTSFYPGKNLGAYGDGGAVMTNDDAIADRVCMLRNHGGARRYEHTVIGVNSRLDGLQAVVLSAKLSRLEEWNQQRRDAATYYGELLADEAAVVTPQTVEGNEHVYHLYVVRVPQRDRVVERLNRAGIGASIHYPIPVHRVPAFSYLGLPEGSFPVAERLSTEILSLPIYPGITLEQQESVVVALSRAIHS